MCIKHLYPDKPSASAHACSDLHSASGDSYHGSRKHDGTKHFFRGGLGIVVSVSGVDVCFLGEEGLRTII